ncbi:Myb-like DNA-binding domain containing protein [Trichomonas vaginalis G3]|uniref:Myb-like DNA-binding domain containing protein n=1 Tax=Trichomonas vaginalis (strain ATCC PRA-98 / G3) TaxID=412133 RepID=A2FVY8_TRIV3|nr:RNA polymerase II transcription regulator recruiting protein [Trichomonas vaginalis G3]EAX90942.1 Myb-like DNA-binding domain containing protein [Trichomonas vaginalis G3]KAI5504376.1 RNA polymerase II transcription regulator recruiting protein [Trichomonas vaginalis G3]|eukprot:XP_001303872.1 Myb-like DNA-binding domain containing protein [Trichomonas vaginalis G3]
MDERGLQVTSTDGMQQMTDQPLDQYAALQQMQLYQLTQPEQAMTMQHAPGRGVWSQQEDELLTRAVMQLGPKKWQDISRFVPTRTSKQCRERWFNCLNPNNKHGAFEPWEDQIIIEKQKEIGNRWSSIAHLLPGRSPGAVKNRWYSGLKSFHPAASMGGTSLNPSLETNLDTTQMTPYQS